MSRNRLSLRLTRHRIIPNARCDGPGPPDVIMMAADWQVEPGSKDERFAREALPFMDDVYRFAVSLTRDPADAQDIVQETFLRAYRSWHTFEPDSDCRRWLFTICRNAFLRSRESRRFEVEVDDAEAEALAAARQHQSMIEDGTDRLLATVDLGPALDRAVSDLEEPFRSTVMLVDVEDQSYEAAAEILGVPIGTVRSRLFRARRQLQGQLRRYALDAGFGLPGIQEAPRHA